MLSTRPTTLGSRMTIKPVMMLLTINMAPMFFMSTTALLPLLCLMSRRRILAGIDISRTLVLGLIHTLFYTTALGLVVLAMMLVVMFLVTFHGLTP
jgi:hypothetical protein